MQKDKKKITIERTLEDIKKAEIAIGHDRSDESIVVLGPSGSGKSTCIAVLYNKWRMEAIFNEKTGNLYLDCPDLPQDMKIEPTAVSGTSYPKKLVIEDNIVLWDTPGLADNKGAQQDLANAFYLRRIIEVSKKVKIIIAFRYSHFDGKANIFLQSLKLFCGAFCGSEQYYQSVGILITDTPLNINSDHIKNVIKINILEADELDIDDEVKTILKHFVSNPQKIIIMKKPEMNIDLNFYYRNFRTEFMNVTSNIKSFSAKKPNLMLSDETINELPNIMLQKSIHLESYVKEAHEIIKNFIKNKFEAVKFDSTLKKSLNGIKISKSLIDDFECAKRNKDVEELYQTFSKYSLNLKEVGELKNIIDCARLLSDINIKIKVDSYIGTIFNSIDGILNYYNKLLFELQGKFCEYCKQEFDNWLKEFLKNPQLVQMHKNAMAIVNYLVESSKQTNFLQFFSTLNTYKDLPSKIDLLKIDNVIETIRTFTEVIEEKNITEDLKNIQNRLINEYSFIDRLKNNLYNRNSFDIENNEIRFNFRAVINPYNEINNNLNQINLQDQLNSLYFDFDYVRQENSRLKEEIENLEGVIQENSRLKEKINEITKIKDEKIKINEDLNKKIENFEKEINIVQYPKLPNTDYPKVSNDQINIGNSNPDKDKKTNQNQCRCNIL